MTELLTVKELAQRLKRSTRYVYAMTSKGFVMPGMRCTIEDAVVWLRNNPFPRASLKGRVRHKTAKHV
jgi:hypothetical protein